MDLLKKIAEEAQQRLDNLGGSASELSPEEISAQATELLNRLQQQR